MEARLVYKINDKEIILECMDLEELDRFTYSSFNSENDIMDCPKYQEKLSKFTRTGELKISYDSFDLPICAMEYLSDFEYDPFKYISHDLTVLVKNKSVIPTKQYVRDNIISAICEFDVVENFYDIFQHKLSLKEKLFYHIGIFYELPEYAFLGIKRVIVDATQNVNGYLTGRIILDELENFYTTKKKNECFQNTTSNVYQKK